MSTITPIPEEDLDAFVSIVLNAYPGFPVSSSEDRDRVREHLSQFITKERPGHLFGLYRKQNLLGGMALYDFTMNVFGTSVQAGGVGLVAVDILHKREKVCKDMISFFLRYYREKGACLTLLHPFRPDFYKDMGFGFGSKMHEYIFPPNHLPAHSKDNICMLTEDDKQDIWDCYTRYVHKTHGMIEKTAFEVDRLFSTQENKIVGYRIGGTVQGYLVFTFKKDQSHFTINDIVVKEFIYETREAFLELLTFLRSQYDQVRFIIFRTQDPYFHHLFSDPRDISGNILPIAYHQSNTSGVGLMYRIIDVEKFFTLLHAHPFGTESCTLKISVRDTFFQENEGSTIVTFKKGFPVPGQKESEADIQIKIKMEMDISDFSSMVLGVVPFSRLYRYGLADISESSYVDVVDHIFRWDEPPQCITDF